MNHETDKDYEALLENYEDAMMRLVMYRVAQEDGRRLLEEAEELERSGFEVPKELDEKCLKLIEKSCASQKRKTAPVPTGAVEDDSPHRFRLHKVGQLAVAAILAAVLLFSVAYAVNEDFRISVLNFFLELREDGSWFSFRNGGTGDFQSQSSGVQGEFPFEFTYIPEGYELFAQEVYAMGADGDGYYCRYVASEDPPYEFYFDICPVSEGATLFVDTEDAVVTEMTIRGHDGWLIEKTYVTSQSESIMYFWFDLTGKYSFCYSSLGISPEESQKIFDGIVMPEQF